MTETVYGPVLDAAVIEQAWLDLARAWIDTYLVLAERAADEAPRTYRRPEHWRLDDEARILVEDVTPLLVCVSQGEPIAPADDRGMVIATVRLQLCAYYRAGEIEEAHTAARRYGWALAALVENQSGPLADLGVQLATRPRQTFGDTLVTREQPNPMGQAIVTFDCLAEIRARGAGPTEPIDPDTDPPDDPAGPTVSTVELDIEPGDPTA